MRALNFLSLALNDQKIDYTKSSGLKICQMNLIIMLNTRANKKPFMT